MHSASSTELSLVSSDIQLFKFSSAHFLLLFFVFHAAAEIFN